MSLHLSLLALFLGVAFHVEAVGREFTVSWIDLLAVGVLLVGTVEAWRRRVVRVDLVLVAYGGLLVVVLVQALVLPDPWSTIGASSRFLTALFILFGLSQLAPGRGETARSWAPAFLVFGLALTAWTLVQLGRALAGTDAGSFYDVKNAIALPIGASNYLAAFLLVSALIGVVYAATRRDWNLVAAIVVLGLVGTLSRGAMLAFGVALVFGAWLARSWQLLAAAGATAVIALALFAGVGGEEQDLERLGIAGGRSVELAAASTAAVTGRSEVTVQAAQDPNTNGRLVLYEAAWNAFLDDPLLGVGLNRLETVTVETGPPHDNAHNLELHALASVGILGTIPYLAIWVLLAWRLRSIGPGTERTALAAAATGLFAHAQIEALAFTRGIEVVLALLLVLAGSHAGAIGIREFALARRRTAHR
ncbi:MAG: O-antigen ligase family protein [Actinobacteria bacterium]|nr:O-antigen ligase family protein [Actinomycetota bacterium]